jgi:hypothetical protein
VAGTSTTSGAAVRNWTATAPRSAATRPRITRSIHLPVSYDQPEPTRKMIGEAIDAGVRHIVLGLIPPYPAGVARWVADDLIGTAH